MKSSHTSQQSCTKSSPKKLQSRFTELNQRHDRETLWKYRNTKISGWRLDVQTLLLLLLATRDLAGQDCMIFSSHIWYILFPAANFSFFFFFCFFFLGDPSTYGSLRLNAMRKSNKSDMHELWRRMLHTRRTACMADARSLARLRNYQRETSFGRLEHLVVSEQVWGSSS
jgi:hypothetical protein